MNQIFETMETVRIYSCIGYVTVWLTLLIVVVVESLQTLHEMDEKQYQDWQNNLDK